MQQYKYFDHVQIEETNQMLREFPDCLKIAYIDFAEKGDNAAEDSVHPHQQRRYYSCLVDRNCQSGEHGEHSRKRPRFRVELPGFPILGDGKGDNQNHAIPFSRGAFAQCIDANQGAYFEQMLMLPCVLGEFRGQSRKRIVGLPEHITSDIGSVGDMAATAETSFGTIIQRSIAVLGARMHYGHPDIMNKQYMMQQGGVSKATKTLNLSEDIFAGMDFALRGNGREICHREYFNLAKGRDLGFNTVIAFFSKLASGAGEQILTRQMFRLGESLQLPEFLTFYYSHVGYYFNQFFISWSMPLLACVWLMAILSDCEDGFEAFQVCNNDPFDRIPSAEVMAKAISQWFSWLMFLFLIATSLPLFAELWLQRSFKTALVRILKQFFTFSPLLFIFQAKTIGHYIINELRFGGASYVSTGRGLPTERRPFMQRQKDKFSGLYMDYATIAYYDGVVLLGLAILVMLAGGIDKASTGAGELRWLFVALGLNIASCFMHRFCSIHTCSHLATSWKMCEFGSHFSSKMGERIGLPGILKSYLNQALVDASALILRYALHASFCWLGMRW
jgi:1,3-beta-glucan synthase